MSEEIGGRTIGSWFKDAWDTCQKHKAQEKMLRQVIEHVVEIAALYILQAKRYHTLLRDPITGSMNYCTSIVDGLPGPVESIKKGYHPSPLVKSPFASPDELEEWSCR